ncbi:sel1 repeat family protein [Photobacterium makurazakiensis]|uniref:tetratricopeptide repeat protein n=1 Tax=Photobacterium makurazakiensis TaxID=2910234 RepID=UPI003D0E5218
MSNLLIGLSVAGGVLSWVVYRYFSTQKMNSKLAIERRLKDDNYQRVLERAKIAEREDKIFKAQTGHVSSQLSLAKEYELTNVREALGWYYQAAKQENTIAQNALARLCKMDIDDPEGEAKSIYWEHVVKANNNDIAAKFELGRYQIRGFGTEIDIEAGLQNIHAAAEAEYIPAQSFLGDWYVSDIAENKAPDEAFIWRVRGALQGDIRACLKTAYCYQTGIAVAKNKLRTTYWLERAAEQGDAEAQQLVAKMYLGAGANDAAVAYIWLSLAYAAGNKSAKAERDEVVQHIGIDAILGVQNVANSIYRVIKVGEVQAHAVIDLLDKVYGREGYRPSAEQLAVLASGDLSGEQGEEQPLVEEVWDEHLDQVNDNTPHTQRDASLAKTTSITDSDKTKEPKQNASANKEYQQQVWQSSWDSFNTESEKL